MPPLLRRSALPAALCALAALPGSAAAQGGYDPAVAVSPSRFTTADAIAVTWRRPAVPTKDDVWSLCRVTGESCRSGVTTAGSASVGGLAEGAYVFELQTEGTGLFYKGRIDIAVDRTAPGPPTVADWRAPPVTGGTMRPVVAAGEPQNAPIVAVRWTRCVGGAQPGTPGCLEGRSSPNDVAIPIDPSPLDPCGVATSPWSAALWLVDAAGNEDRRTAATTALAIPAIACAPAAPPPPARTRVALTGAGRLRGAADRRRAALAVSVAPRTATGAVALRITPRRGGTRLPAIRTTRTVRAGRATWRGRLPDRSTSVRVVAAYGGDPRHGPARRAFVVRLTPGR
jgi:hypothetical protein